MLKYIYYIYWMTNQKEAWSIILESQRQADLQREREERNYRNMLQKQYKRGLERQINHQRMERQRSIQEEKYQDRLAVQQTVQKFEMNRGLWRGPSRDNVHIKSQASVNSRNENPKETIDAYLAQAGKVEDNRQRQSLPRIETSNLLGNYQSNSQNNILSKMSRNNSEDSLKGSRKGSLGYLKMEEPGHFFDQDFKAIQQKMQEDYGKDLKRQILERERRRKQARNLELLRDANCVHTFQRESASLQMENRQRKLQNRRELYNYLSQQVEEQKRKNVGLMRMGERQTIRNQPLVRNGSQVLMPGRETLLLDPQRKKQLETVVKTISAEHGPDYAY